MQIYLTLRHCGSKFPKPLLMRSILKRTCYNSGNNRKVLPVALQYMYGESNKVQNEPLKPATEYDIEGIIEKENNEGEEGEEGGHDCQDCYNRSASREIATWLFILSLFTVWLN